MNYTINNLTQVSDCDVLLTWAGKEKAELTFKKISEERLTVKYSSTSLEVESELQGVLIELTALDSVIASLPEGEIKEDKLKKKTKLVYRKFLLEDRKESYGTIALLEKELDLERVNKEIEEVDAFILAITNHKATL
ncbi:hypothetical protein FIA58_011775 [Flavobacterium jejuense]|uniref:Uncharacterized protein n=1 Tax=Flavobacterium jejuense TaxID=1544455 RepID=A0ABX0IU53_9FLAO|nr:hypothetical protein [Flavobacterium jejuense]NHN26359.1 hypothetical protein [Flavobacterium jejuense]